MPGAAAILREHERMCSLKRSASSPTKRPTITLLRSRHGELFPSPAQSMPTVAEVPLDEHARMILEGSCPPSPLPGQRTAFLPLRYTRNIRKRNSRDLENEVGKIKDGRPGIEVSEKLTDREKDLEQALKWLRQEIVNMKGQDKDLMRHLLELRADIHQLQGIRSCQSVECNLSTLSAASPSALLPLDPDCYPISRHSRAVSMTSISSGQGAENDDGILEEDEPGVVFSTRL